MDSKLAALGAFLAGGALVGVITLATGSAHGVGTTTPAYTESSAQYTAQSAWVQSITTIVSGTATTALSIPSGQRLTITGVIAGGQDTVGIECNISGEMNGTSVSYQLTVGTGNESSSETSSMYLELGNISCGAGNDQTVSLVGYLTPIPAGQS